MDHLPCVYEGKVTWLSTHIQLFVLVCDSCIYTTEFQGQYNLQFPNEHGLYRPALI